MNNYPETGIVVWVVDGDTVVLGPNERGPYIRYMGIDTPGKKEPFGKEALYFNISKVYGKSIRLEYDVTKVDEFDRLLAYVFVINPLTQLEVFVNAELIRVGLARYFVFEPDIKYARELFDAEKEAKENRLGVWSA